MRVINKTERNRYSVLADRSIDSGSKSADMDLLGFTTALSELIDGCGKSFCIRLNAQEKLLISRLLELDKESYSVKPNDKSCNSNYFKSIVLKRSSEEKAKKIALIEALRKKEEAIVSETTYASRNDIDEARAKSLSLRGEVPAKKLDNKSDEPVSLNDLIGNNKFIEESMKYSNIKTTVASEEGWDMDKINAPKVADTVQVTSGNSAEKSADNNEDAEEKPAKKTSRRRRKESKQ